MAKLRSWKVRVKSPLYKTAPDGWGGTTYYNPVESIYVVARSAKSAMYQAKVMSGYNEEDAKNRSKILYCSEIEEL